MIDRGRIAANGSTISTSVLIYMATLKNWKRRIKR